MKNLIQICFLLFATNAAGQKNNISTFSKTNLGIVSADYVVGYNQNTLAKLQDNDTISINYNSQGCFNTSFAKIIITKESNGFVAKLYNVNGDNIIEERNDPFHVNRDSLLKTVILTKKNIKDFIRFENELNHIRLGGCTLTEVYDIKSPYLNIKKTDSSCRWNGFYFLRDSFFGKKE
jgi:hypothetical protein